MLATLVVYIPYLYFSGALVFLGQDQSSLMEEQIEAGDYSKPSRSKVDHKKVIELSQDISGLEELIEIDQQTRDLSVSKAAREAIRGFGTKKAKAYLTKVRALDMAVKNTSSIPIRHTVSLSP